MEKRKYITPIYYFEEFELSQAVAANCGDSKDPYITSTSGDYTVCGIYIDMDHNGKISAPDTFLFLGKDTCGLYKVDSSYVPGEFLSEPQSGEFIQTQYERYCYHNPEDNKLFGS